MKEFLLQGGIAAAFSLVGLFITADSMRGALVGGALYLAYCLIRADGPRWRS